ncbi:MAG: hypothetical protein SVU32_04665 [Candidatus Nanohaloarchaea archaeon]|nr:hypothetical protein [Candidatus Nanohaloarchaea archaeon]
MIARIYYLNWDEEASNTGPATDRFHEYGIADRDELPDGYSQDTFADLYREVADDVDVDGPEDAWRQWNRGSGYESSTFYEAEERSMCVGDVVEIDDRYYLAAPVGFKEIDIYDEEGDG